MGKKIDQVNVLFIFLAFVAEKFDQIWLFIEAKLEISVPLYIKNILRACGFDNGVSIASIDEDDIEYFVNEVRNGNVMKFFIENENNILEGTEIPAPKFEFTRGHKKLLLSIVEFLKTHAKENGTNHFISEVAPNKQIAKNTTNKPGLARKGSRKILNFPNNQKRQKFLRRSLPIENHNNFPNGNMKIQEGILICKAITSLINFTPELYCEVSINYKIKNRMSPSVSKMSRVRPTRWRLIFRISIIFLRLCHNRCGLQLFKYNKNKYTQRNIWGKSE